MYSTCLYCTKSLGANDVLETLPIGRRVAFDANQGRLWVVCASCGKWNLVPFDNRLESIDACERLFSDTPTRFSTDHIGLARAREGLELVRIGAPQRPEFASWRYGAEYRRRRTRTLVLTGSAGVAGGALWGAFQTGLLFGIPFHPGHPALQLFFGGSALSTGIFHSARLAHSRQMKLRTVNPVSGKPLMVRYSGLKLATVVQRDDQLTLQLDARWWSSVSLRLVGEPAEQLARRILGRLNMANGTSRQLAGAVEKVPALLASDDVSLLGELYRARVIPKRFMAALPISVMPAADRLALEMVANESDERRWLTGELALLERRWREAEALAKIADSLAVPDTLSS